MTPRIRLAAAAAILLVAGTVTYAEPPPPTLPHPSPPAGPLPVPYPDSPQPPGPECPPSLCPRAAGTLQLSGGASTIEVESFSWGAASASDGPTTVNTSDPQEGGQVARSKPRVSEIPVVKRYDKSSPVMTSDPQEGGQVTGGPVYTSDPQEGGQVAGRKAGGTQHETLEGATSREGSVQSVMPEQSVASPRDSSTGLATGKRQHMPIRMRQGSVDVTMPEGVCVAGAHYPAVTLRSGDKAYEMRDVTIASCTPVATAKGKKDKAKLDYMVVKMETVLISG